MPELPEVESSMRGLYPYLKDACIESIIIRCDKLRFPIPKAELADLAGRKITNISRRAKYILLHFDTGILVIHLGMSGHLQILKKHPPAKKHDHIDIILTSEYCLRYHDPRRFGSFIWTHRFDESHLGPEPLEALFNADYLYQMLRHRRAAIKTLVMNAKVVVGVGNIYASEALYMAGIHPAQAACQLTKEDCEQLVQAIQEVLRAAIAQGGSSIQNYINSHGKPGYFAQAHQVYQKTKEPCRQCQTPIEQMIISQRSSFYCPKCQKLR